MAKTRQQKEVELKKLEESMQKAQAVIFVDYAGLTVEASTALRKKSKAADCEFLVSKKTLIAKAAASASVEGLDTASLKGNVGLIFGYADPVTPAKLATELAKSVESVHVLAGVMDKKFIDATAVKSLSALPSKHELLGMLVGTLNAPISGFVRVLAGNLSGLVTVMKAIAEKKPA